MDGGNELQLEALLCVRYKSLHTSPDSPPSGALRWALLPPFYSEEVEAQQSREGAADLSSSQSCDPALEPGASQSSAHEPFLFLLHLQRSFHERGESYFSLLCCSKVVLFPLRVLKY